MNNRINKWSSKHINTVNQDLIYSTFDRILDNGEVLEPYLKEFRNKYSQYF
jgi:hypothetical protein